MENIFQCNICGEKFNSSLEFCSGCGADKTNFVDIDNVNLSISEEKKEPATLKVSVEKKSKQQKKTEHVDKHKTISATKLVYFVIALLFVGSVILISSGIFDKVLPSQSTVNTNTDPNNPHSGHDLNQLEQINEMQKAVDANPNDLNSLLNLAHLLNDSGFKDKAIERYEQYLKKNSKVADVWVDMGVCYFELGKNSEAISKMEKALLIEPKHQIAHLNLGIVNLSSGNKEKALDWWKKAYEINPTSEIGKRAQELINQH